MASTSPRSHELLLEAAARALEEGIFPENEEENEGLDFYLAAHLPRITELHKMPDGKAHAYHFFLATTTTTSIFPANPNLVWKTRAQVKACRQTEQGRHAYPIVNQARALLETALRTGGGVLTGPGWDELQQYLASDEDDKDEEEAHHHHTSSSVSSLLRQASLLKRPAQLPVTLLSGFLGAGKTTLLRHILQNQQDWRVAVLVNDMNELNIDAALVAHDRRRVVRTTHEEERIVSLANGCICCTLREDLLAQIVALASEQTFDYLLIESSGISEPLAVAETFAFEDAEGRSLSSLARLDTTVTVVDAADLHRHLRASGKLAAASSEATRGGECPLAMCEEEESETDKTLADLMVEQIEFADVVILNKVDLLPPSSSSSSSSHGLTSLPTLQALVHTLNPGAKVLVADHARVALGEILNTGLFSLDKAQQAPGWLRELRGTAPEHQKVPETLEYDVSSFCYRRTRPFHPARLHALVFGDDGKEEKEEKGALACLIRVKGYLWLSTHMQHMVFWSLAGSVHSFTSHDDDRWLAATDPAEWPEETLTLAQLHEKWMPVWGDRRQEVVLIGVHMDQAAVAAALDACLLTEAEMREGAWREDVAGDVFSLLFFGKDEEESGDEESEDESEEEESN